MEVINNFAAVRLLINTYMIKRLKSSLKPVNQEKFIEEVWSQFREKGFYYSRTSILFTWKNLLDNYQYYKKNFAPENAQKEWNYFDLMDNCFDDSRRTPEKFSDSKWTFCLIESLSKHRAAVLNGGLTMNILQAVEDDFRKNENFHITQKDIFNQWLILKRMYKKYLSNNAYKFNKNYMYFNALKDFFEKGELDYNTEPAIKRTNESISQSELDTAVASITAVDSNNEIKKRKIENITDVAEPTSTSDNINVSSSNELCTEFMPFNNEMHNTLLQCFKKHKKQLRNLGGGIDNDTLNEIFEEFQKLGYNVAKSSICNEWNDLTCRYELIKNTEQPQKWAHYEDMHYVYTNDDTVDSIHQTEVIDDNDNESTVDSLVVNNLGKTLKIANDMEISERLLNIYECNNKEFLEIKDTLLERNLLREETNYLLAMFIEKFNKRKH